MVWRVNLRRNKFYAQLLDTFLFFWHIKEVAFWFPWEHKLATLAQLVEQQTENLRVWSSILRGGNRKSIYYIDLVKNDLTAGVQKITIYYDRHKTSLDAGLL